MRIKYEFLTGEVIEIEVEEAVGEIIVELERNEYNSNRRETRRHESYSDNNDKQETLVDLSVDVETKVISRIEYEVLYKAITKLQPQQQELVRKMFFEYHSIIHIAREEGVGESTIRDRLNRIYKKLKNILT